MNEILIQVTENGFLVKQHNPYSIGSISNTDIPKMWSFETFESMSDFLHKNLNKNTVVKS